MQVKLRIASLVNNPDWPYAKKLAEETIKAMEREAIDEEDDAKASGLRRDARGARKFWNTFLNQLTIAAQITNEPTNDDFLEVCDM
jgi:hypothetical protein